MKDLLNSLYWDIERDLKSMQVSKMTLCERIKYEKAMVNLKTLKNVVDKCYIEKG